MKCFLLVKRIIVLILFICYTPVNSQTVFKSENCTIGIAAGKATSDGRPMIWKTTDGGGEGNRVLQYVASEKYKFISENIPGRTGATAMGVNENGFAILNSQSGDLEGGNSGYGNTSFMWAALGKCLSLVDLEYFLDSTNVTGRRTTANFAALDSTGAVAIYEASATQYWKFDANNTSIAPEGYIIRANFSINGGGSEGIDRYNRSFKIIADFYNGDSLNYKSILRYQMRDFSDWDSNPIPIPFSGQWVLDVPFGYIYSENSICRSSSLSSAVIHGVLPDESAKLSTMWELLGQPAATIAVPYWPVGKSPVLAYNLPSSRLSDLAKCIKAILFNYIENDNYIDTYKLRDEDGNGLWGATFLAEDSILTAAEAKLQQWRTGSFSIEEMLASESEYAQHAYSKLRNAHDQLLTFNTANIQISKVFSPYDEITESTPLNSGDDSQSIIYLPFPFEYDGIKYDEIQISTNGWLEFGKGEAGSDSGLSTAAQLSYVGAVNNERLAGTDRPSKALAPWWDDLTTGANGQVSYKTDGSYPDRNLIVQWKDMQTYSDGSTTTINFQAHLQETTNTIEFHYGPVTAGTYTGDGASIGFKDYLGGALRFYDLEEDKICYKDELISSLNPLKDWPGPDSCLIIKTYKTPTGIDRIVSNIAKSMRLFQNYPNPFNPTTTISYQLPKSSQVDLSIYTLLGQKLATLVNKKQQAGTYKIEWNATGFASGIYIYKISTDQVFSNSKKLLLIK